MLPTAVYTLDAPLATCFSGDFLLQEKNGGALKLNLLSSAVFEGTTTFTSISIKTTDLGNSEERTRKGAAIHNKVTRYCM